MSDRLSADEITVELEHTPGWTYDGSVLVREYDRGDFNGSIAFVNAIAAKANALDHHPDLAISWNTVTVRLSSHDVGGISSRDFTLATQISALSETP